MINAFFNKYMGEAQGRDIAVAVSGGADSMALCFALSECLPDINVHALTVDHGLRVEAADEARHVAEQLSRLLNVNHNILKWDHSGDKPNARIQELARNARYDLMFGYMGEHGLNHLFLGHHMEDQAETFLFRLAKGSGVDGLSCMLPMQSMDNGASLCRPMLGVDKACLIDLCNDRGVDFIDDPSNKCDDYARVRLRKSMDILSSEGLSSKRLSVCAARHARARAALEYAADEAFDRCLTQKELKRIVFGLSELRSAPEEIVLRLILKAMAHLTRSDGYGARLDRVENLCLDLINSEHFRKRTLGGIIFELNINGGEFVMSLEKVT